MRHDFTSLKGEVGVIGPTMGSLDYVTNMLFKKQDPHRRIKRKLPSWKTFGSVSMERSESLWILMGPIGISKTKEQYFSSTLKSIDNELIKMNSHLMLVHGQNDDLELGKEMCSKLHNVHMADPYEMVLTNDGGILCIGGGVQLDANWRKNRGMDAVNHPPIFSEDKLQEAIGKDVVKYVVSPLAPTFVVPPPTNTNPWLSENEEASKEVMAASIAIDKNYVALMERMMTPKSWFINSDQLVRSPSSVSFIVIGKKSSMKIGHGDDLIVSIDDGKVSNRFYGEIANGVNVEIDPTPDLIHDDTENPFDNEIGNVPEGLYFMAQQERMQVLRFNEDNQAYYEPIHTINAV